MTEESRKGEINKLCGSNDSETGSEEMDPHVGLCIKIVARCGFYFPVSLQHNEGYLLNINTEMNTGASAAVTFAAELLMMYAAFYTTLLQGYIRV